ncbi:DUF397 domain-containing protein [Streptomyces seoulensis]|uniref:DUF397 domain-containing protein n=1 Tax=Streptomyces seoulensis TaxID=73044 RepID=A0A4P6TZD1_STRSO|nr:DUF397 domain-containing protein [Streptomyces seoulensis]QBJ91981.1 DUF397 domain-containing protein [Streptomyces seoulensis]
MSETPNWFKSSYSSNGGACVEVATNLLPSHGTIPVRDSKHRAGSVLELRAAAFSTFVTGVKNGQFETL